MDTGPDSSRANRDITAVITNYNYGRYLAEAVDSVLRQGASRGGRRRRLDGAAFPTLPADVELIRQENQGVATRTERGPGARAVAATSSCWTPTTASHRARWRRCARPLDADPQLGFAYGRMRFFGDWDGRASLSAVRPVRPALPAHDRAQALARREVFAATGGFDPEFEQFEDWEHWVNALAHGWQGQQVDAVTVEYRRHEGSKHSRDRPEYKQAFRRLRDEACRALREPSARPPERSRAPLVPRVLGPPAGSGPLEGALHRLLLAKSRLSKPFYRPIQSHMRKAAVVPAFNEAGSIARGRRRDPRMPIPTSRSSSSTTAPPTAPPSSARARGRDGAQPPYNLGIGAAVQTGLQYAYDHDFDVAVQIDGDGQHDSTELAKLLAP